MPPEPSYFPLRWENTGEQWWYASPIDYAAANGHYDLVSELLHLDSNLLIKLTSLRRLRRLESLWDHHSNVHVAKCRCQVAKRLMYECQKGPNNNNSLIRAGYGGWLLYTAAAAGDVEFVKDLLERDPLLVFGEGEYGVTEIFYAAASSKSGEAFRVVLESALSPRRFGGEGNVELLKREMMKRAVHAAARGGNVEVLRELVGECGDVFGCRDAQGSTLLHTASARGQIEVVKYLIASFEMSTLVDSQGNSALHVAAYRGHLAVVECLIGASPSLASLANSYGDTFLHMAVAGFRALGFQRVDKQIELIQQLVRGDIVNIVHDIVNICNNNGRTALHIAVSENIQSSVAELLMTVPSVDLNIRDGDGMTPLDILKQMPKSPSSEILIKQLVSAGGIVSECRDHKAGSDIVPKTHSIGKSPGTSFRIPDAEIFLYTGVDNASDASGDRSSLQLSSFSCEMIQVDSARSVCNKKIGSVSNAARRLKYILQWPRRKKKIESSIDLRDDDSLDSFSPSTDFEDNPIPLRQIYTKGSSFPSNKRIHSARISLPSPYTKMKYTASLTHGVIQAAPLFASPAQSSASPLSRSSFSSPAFIDKEKGADNVASPRANGKASVRHSRQSSISRKMINQYLCVGAQCVEDEESISSTLSTRSHKHSSSLVA